MACDAPPVGVEKPTLLAGQSSDERDASWMREALAEAAHAASHGDVPVGAVLVDQNGQELARGHNRRELDADPTAHAELVALRAAAATLGRWRLDDTTLYVTLEPCAMCAGALVNARVGRLVFGASDPKAGAVCSLYQIASDLRLNHRVDCSGGLLAEASIDLLQGFFQALRSKRALIG